MIPLLYLVLIMILFLILELLICSIFLVFFRIRIGRRCWKCKILKKSCSPKISKRKSSYVEFNLNEMSSNSSSCSNGIDFPNIREHVKMENLPTEILAEVEVHRENEDQSELDESGSDNTSYYSCISV